MFRDEQILYFFQKVLRGKAAKTFVLVLIFLQVFTVPISVFAEEIIAETPVVAQEEVVTPPQEVLEVVLESEPALPGEPNPALDDAIAESLGEEVLEPISETVTPENENVEPVLETEILQEVLPEENILESDPEATATTTPEIISEIILETASTTTDVATSTEEILVPEEVVDLNPTEVSTEKTDITLPESLNDAFVVSYKNLSENLPFEMLVEGSNLESSILKVGEEYFYNDAFLNTDLKYEVTEKGLKESIILKEENHPTDFKYRLNLDKFDFVQTSPNEIVLYKKGKSGNELFKLYTVTAPLMYDSAGSQSNSLVFGVQENILTLTPDSAWLETAVYPVVVDPTIEITVLNVHSHPVQGEHWNVDFVTVGTADLTITPADQATIDEDEFTSLFCGSEDRTANAQVLANDVIFYPNWSCDDVARVSHMTLVTGSHHLLFSFAGVFADVEEVAIAEAFNGLTDDLISYWKMDEASGSLIDVIGNNDLTETSGTIPTATGKVSNARDFESGDTEYFEIADNLDVSTGDIDFTFSAWVQLESVGGPRAVLSQWSATQRGYLLYYSHSNLHFNWAVGDGASTNRGVVDPTGSVSTGQWYHLIAWHDAALNEVGLSIDGTVSTTSTSGAAGDSTAEFRIGEQVGGGAPWDGLIDEVGFWKRVLTPAERTALYNNGNGVNFIDGTQRYWVGGGSSSNWNATGPTNWAYHSDGPNNAPVPDATSDVFFDGVGGGASNSTLSASITINSLDMTGYTNTLTHNAGVTLTIDGNGVIAKWSAGMTYTRGDSVTSLVSFTGTSGTNLFTSGGKTFSNITQNGPGGTTQLQDALTTGTNSTITLTQGTLDTNGQTVITGGFSSNTSSTRTMTFGSSAISLGNASGNCWNSSNVTNLTVTVNTAVITCTGPVLFTSGAKDFNGLSLVFTGAGAAGVNAPGSTFANVTRTGTAVKTDSFVIDDFTVTGTLTINGNSSVNRILVAGETIGTAETITAANVSISNADFKDITGAGAGNWDLSTITGLSGDAGGNSGITFTPAQTNYWVGGTGSWSTVGEWASSSGGGAGTGRVPLPQDDAIFNASSFSAGSQAVTQDMPRAGKNINWTGVTFTPTWTTNTVSSVFGSLTLVSTMNFGPSGDYTFEGRGVYTLTSGGKAWSNNVTINAPGGSYTLQDNFVISPNTNRTFAVTAGSFDANNFNVTATAFSSSNSNTRAITMGSGIWYVGGSSSSGIKWNTATITGLTFNANTSTISITGSGANSKTFAGGGLTFNNLAFSNTTAGAILIITGSNTFNDFLVSGGNAQTIQFTAGTTQTFNTFTVSGTAGNIISLDSTTSGTHNLVKAGGGVISSDYLNIQHSVATPSNTWYAGANSTNNQGVTTAGSGWIFSAPDLTAPTVTSISSDKADGSYTTGEVIDIDVTFSEAVTSTGNVTVTLETGATDRTCTFTVTSATTGTCNYTVQNGDESLDLDASISGTIADASANSMSNFVPATSLATNKDLVIYVVNVPTVSTSPATAVTDTSVTLNGAIDVTGGENSTQRGFEWGTTILYGSETTEAGSFGTGSFTASLSSLVCGTTYHFRAYSENSEGRGVGADESFTTSDCAVAPVSNPGVGSNGPIFGSSFAGSFFPPSPQPGAPVKETPTTVPEVVVVPPVVVIVPKPKAPTTTKPKEIFIPKTIENIPPVSEVTYVKVPITGPKETVFAPAPEKIAEVPKATTSVKTPGKTFSFNFPKLSLPKITFPEISFPEVDFPKVNISMYATKVGSGISDSLSKVKQVSKIGTEKVKETLTDTSKVTKNTLVRVTARLDSVLSNISGGMKGVASGASNTFTNVTKNTLSYISSIQLPTFAFGKKENDKKEIVQNPVVVKVEEPSPKEEDVIVLRAGELELVANQDSPVQTIVGFKFNAEVVPKGKAKSVGGTYKFSDVDLDGVWTAEVAMPEVSGEFKLNTHIAYEDGTTKSVQSDVLIDPEGYIYEKHARGELRIESAEVRLWQEIDGEWKLWQAGKYNQENPQITNNTGSYSFLAPAGKYYLEVVAKDYGSYKSEVFGLTTASPVHMPIELKYSGE